MSEVIAHVNVEGRKLLKQQINQAVRDVFQLDVLPEAIQNSPVTPEGVEYNQAKFDSKQHRPGTKIDPVKLKGTGHNRQSLDLTFDETPSGTRVELFSQSGYGGYLEVGTSKMRAQPYIWPAWLKFKDKIAELLRG